MAATVTTVLGIAETLGFGGGDVDMVSGMKLGDMDLSQVVSPAFPIQTAKATS
jgi:hypothetical protein